MKTSDKVAEAAGVVTRISSSCALTGAGLIFVGSLMKKPGIIRTGLKVINVAIPTTAAFAVVGGAATLISINQETKVENSEFSTKKGKKA